MRFAGEIIERIQCEAAREELDKIVWDRIGSESASELRESKSKRQRQDRNRTLQDT